jgi:CubicO group peptidase (beta-lactamase class C family)
MPVEVNIPMRLQPADFSRNLCFALGIAMLAGCASAPPQAPVIARDDLDAVRVYMTQQIRERMAKHDVTGLSIALVDDQQVVWAEGFGYADKANKIPANADTVYRVGSITKLFTATTAMQLAEESRFDIDKPLQSYLPGFSIKSRFGGTPAITPRMLMTHHSGLPSDWQRSMWAAQPEPFTKLVSYLKDEYAAYPPNTVLSYSNVGVTLLGHAMQQAAGKDYAALVTRRLLQPLGMTHSSLTPRAESPGMSKSYRKGSEENEPGLRDVPAGGLNSSVTDLARFLEMVFADGRAGGQQILKPATLAEMLRPQNADIPLDRDQPIGLGWFLMPLEGVDAEAAGPAIRHGGATVLHHAQMIALTKHKLGVIVLANSSSARDVVNSIATETLKLALQAKTGIAPLPRKRSPNSIRLLSDDDLKAFTGHYATPFGFATVEGSGYNYLRADLFGKRFGLVLRQDGYLGLQYRLLGLIPLPVDALADIGLSRENIAGHEVLLAHSNGRAILAGEKITPVPLSAAWLSRLGEYEIVNAEEGSAFQPDRIALKERDGFLVVEATVRDLSSDPIRMAVAPVSDTELVVLGLGRQMGETLRIVPATDGEQVLYSGYVLKKKPAKE